MMTFNEYYAVVSEDISSSALGPAASDGNIETGVTQSADMRSAFPLIPAQKKKKVRKNKKKLKEDFIATTKSPVKLTTNKQMVSLSSTKPAIQTRVKPERIAV